MNLPDIPANYTQIIVALIGLGGGGFVINRVADKRAERAPKPRPKATQDDVQQLRESVDSRIDDLEARLEDTVQRLTNRTQQYNGIRAAWYALRDLVIGWKGQVERHDAGSPPMPAQLLDLLYNPLPVEDDPEVYDTKRREEIQRLRDFNLTNKPDEDTLRRRPRH